MVMWNRKNRADGKLKKKLHSLGRNKNFPQKGTVKPYLG
jgi:hypothetical protein